MYVNKWQLKNSCSRVGLPEEFRRHVIFGTFNFWCYINFRCSIWVLWIFIFGSLVSALKPRPIFSIFSFLKNVLAYLELLYIFCRITFLLSFNSHSKNPVWIFEIHWEWKKQIVMKIQCIFHSAKIQPFNFCPKYLEKIGKQNKCQNFNFTALVLVNFGGSG